MNRSTTPLWLTGNRVPRTRGDEPRVNLPYGDRERVPRTRGDEPGSPLRGNPGVQCSPHPRG